PGKPVRIAEMSGRLRNYHRDVSGGARHAAIGIAVSHRCDLLVAVAQGAGGAGELQRAALEFLGTHEIHHWMMAALGGGLLVFPLSPCGRGCPREAKAGEGSLSADTDPSSGTDFVRATFSHKGRI